MGLLKKKPNPRRGTMRPVQVEICDQCGVPAKFRIYLTVDSLLTLCGHHFRRHEVAMMAKGYAAEEL